MKVLSRDLNLTSGIGLENLCRQRVAEKPG